MASQEQKLKVLDDPAAWSFFAEGAANIVYQQKRKTSNSNTTVGTTSDTIPDTSLNPNPDTSLNTDPHGQLLLLRARKDIQGSPSTLEVSQFLETHVYPVLGEYMVWMEMVKLGDGFLKALSEEGEEEEEEEQQHQEAGKELGRGHITHRRFDAPLNLNDPYAFLMENLGLSVNEEKDGFVSSIKVLKPVAGYKLLVKVRGSTKDENDDTHGNEIVETVLEFKPKWLLPSPTPSRSEICSFLQQKELGNGDEKKLHKERESEIEKLLNSPVLRCRTCALAYSRNKPAPLVCPLDYISPSSSSSQPSPSFSNIFEPIQISLNTIIPVASQFPISQILSQVIPNNPLFKQLQELQTRDKHGILSFTKESQEPDLGFLVATAARDCTLFVSISSIPPPPPSSVSSNQHVATVNNKPYYISLKLTDVDLKKPSPQKCRYWADIEASLWVDGWYTRTDLPVCNYYKK